MFAASNPGTLFLLTFHLPFVVYNNARIILEVDENTILPAEWLALPDYYRRHN
jgi:hypothetical protein